MAEQHPDADLVPVPRVLLAELERLAVKGLTLEARHNGVVAASGVERLFAALDAARQATATVRSWPGELVSAAEAAQALGIGKRAVLLRIAAGTLPARRVGGRWLIDPDALPDREAA